MALIAGFGIASANDAAGAERLPSAPQGDTFAIPKQVIANGGGQSGAGVYVITGTIGQADAEPLHPATGGDFAITGGFWSRRSGTPQLDAIFADDFETPP